MSQSFIGFQTHASWLFTLIGKSHVEQGNNVFVRSERAMSWLGECEAWAFEWSNSASIYEFESPVQMCQFVKTGFECNGSHGSNLRPNVLWANGKAQTAVHFHLKLCSLFLVSSNLCFVFRIKLKLASPKPKNQNNGWLLLSNQSTWNRRESNRGRSENILERLQFRSNWLLDLINE